VPLGVQRFRVHRFKGLRVQRFPPSPGYGGTGRVQRFRVHRFRVHRFKGSVVQIERFNVER
jgi:hypothetical protein